jgi:copper oxidase (laccase) domain-containing protein
VGDDASHVITNRTRAARAFGVELDVLVFAEQVHGANATVVTGVECGRGAHHLGDAVPASDALVTSMPGVPLVMLVADCVPLALFDAEARVLAVVHAGWRGTLEVMAGLGGQPGRTLAFVGPGVSPADYQVDAPVVDGLGAAVAPRPLDPGIAPEDGPGHWRVDLKAANRQQLLLAGVPPAQVLDCGLTTADEDFFSDRAARPCGRFGLMAQLLA